MSTNHLLLQMESNSFMLSFILKETKGRLDIKYDSEGVHYYKLWPHSHPDQDDMCSPGEIGSDELTLSKAVCVGTEHYFEIETMTLYYIRQLSELLSRKKLE